MQEHVLNNVGAANAWSSYHKLSICCTNNFENAVLYCFNPNIILHYWHIYIYIYVDINRESVQLCMHATTRQYWTSEKNLMSSIAPLTEFKSHMQWQKPFQTGKDKTAYWKWRQYTNCIKQLQSPFCMDKLQLLDQAS